MFRIGTSGWHYEHWRGVFYPPGLAREQWLGHYAGFFDTVEINNSFYRLPSDAALHGWHDATPAGFLFSVKASRYLTHMKKLQEPQAGLAKLLPPLAALGDKLGPLLFQLPPRWRCNAPRLAEFLAALPAGREYTFELRDPSWHCPEVLELLRAHNAAFCIYDLAGFCSPLHVTADFAYVRLHGPGGAYSGCYSDVALAQWVARIREWHGLRRVYVYFDNDQAGHAVQNALALKALLP